MDIDAKGRHHIGTQSFTDSQYSLIETGRRHKLEAKALYYSAREGNPGPDRLTAYQRALGLLSAASVCYRMVGYEDGQHETLVNLTKKGIAQYMNNGVPV